MFGKDKSKDKLIQNIQTIYMEISKEKGLPLGDFPDPRMMQEKLPSYDFKKFKALDKKKMAALEDMLTVDVPRLLKLAPDEETQDAQLDQVSSTPSPFAVMKTGGQTENSAFNSEWYIAPDPAEYKQEFEAIDTKGAGKVS